MSISFLNTAYGTNGFTAEHEQAIKDLNQLEEIILFFDGDQAGREATKRVSEKLHQLKSEIKISKINTPEGEDVNSLSTSHEEGIFNHLIEAEQPSATKTLPHSNTSTQLDSNNPFKLTYRTVLANYYVKGGLRN